MKTKAHTPSSPRPVAHAITQRGLSVLVNNKSSAIRIKRPLFGVGMREERGERGVCNLGLFNEHLRYGTRSSPLSLLTTQSVSRLLSPPSTRRPRRLAQGKLLTSSLSVFRRYRSPLQYLIREIQDRLRAAEVLLQLDHLAVLKFFRKGQDILDRRAAK
jgi:hypothetical protein